MTILRRILIFVVGLLLVATGGALALVKMSAGPTPSAEKSKLVFWVDDAAEASQLSEELKAKDYVVFNKPATREDTVEANFRLAMTSENKDILKSIAQVLADSGHRELKYSDDGTTLFFGKVYAQKTQAQRKADSLFSKEKIRFDVIPGSKKIKKKSNRVIITKISDNLVDPLVESVDSKYKIAEINQEQDESTHTDDAE